MHDDRRPDRAEYHRGEDDLLDRRVDVEQRDVGDQQQNDDGREREDGRIAWALIRLDGSTCRGEPVSR